MYWLTFAMYLIFWNCSYNITLANVFSLSSTFCHTVPGFCYCCWSPKLQRLVGHTHVLLRLCLHLPLWTKTRKQYNILAGYFPCLPSQWQCQKPGTADIPPSTLSCWAAPCPMYGQINTLTEIAATIMGNVMVLYTKLVFQVFQCYLTIIQSIYCIFLLVWCLFSFWY